MKWFGVRQDQDFSRDDKVANRAIEYLNKPGEKNEKWAAVTILLNLISKRKLSNSVLKQIVDLRWSDLNMRIATKADLEILEYLTNSSKKDQILFANILYNKNCNSSVAFKIKESCDKSERGLQNSKYIDRKFGKESTENGELD